MKLTPDSERRRRFDALPEDDWLGTPVPYAGIARETVEAARANLSDRHRPRRPAERYFELRGLLRCEGCGLRLTTYTTGADRTTGKKYAYYVCQTRRKYGPRASDACPAGPLLPAGAAEDEVLQHVEDLLDDPREVARRMDEAMERERAALRDPSTTERVLAGRAAELASKRERLMDLALDGPFGKDEIACRAAALDEERDSVERELRRVRDAAGRVGELERTRRALAEAFGTGLTLGLTWMPPRLRREIYEALGLRFTVDASGGMRGEARVDTAVIRFSREVERYARALLEAEKRIADAPPDAGRVDAIENPDGSVSEVYVSPTQARVERIERELAQVRRELSSSSVTDMTSSEMSKLA